MDGYVEKPKALPRNLSRLSRPSESLNSTFEFDNEANPSFKVIDPRKIKFKQGIQRFHPRINLPKRKCR